MELSTPAGLESLARSVAEQLGADRAEKDGDTGRVRIVYADGHALELVPNRPRTRITVTAILPEQAAAHGIEVKTITVTALPRPRPSQNQAKATARHTADHIRQRLLPAHSAALTELRERTAHQVATLQRADAALAGFLDRPRGGVAISEQLVRRPLGWTVRAPSPGGTRRSTGPPAPWHRSWPTSCAGPDWRRRSRTEAATCSSPRPRPSRPTPGSGSPLPPGAQDGTWSTSSPARACGRPGVGPGDFADKTAPWCR